MEIRNKELIIDEYLSCMKRVISHYTHEIVWIPRFCNIYVSDFNPLSVFALLSEHKAGKGAILSFNLKKLHFIKVSNRSKKVQQEFLSKRFDEIIEELEKRGK